MCPFIDDEEFNYENSSSSEQFNRGMVSNFFKNDRKYFLIGGSIIVVVFLTVLGLINSNTTVNIDELPVIHAEQTEFKEKPLENKQIQHQDKIVYDNISGYKRPVVEKLAAQPETIVDIPEIDVSESLSAEEKQNIMQAFDDLAPDKEYKINYKTRNYSANSKNYQVGALSESENKTLQVLKNKKKLSLNEKKLLSELEKKVLNSYKTEESGNNIVLPPINKIDGTTKTSKKRLKDIVKEQNSKQQFNNKSNDKSQNIMVQIASVTSKAAAEREYLRIRLRNRFLSGKGKKIVKVDLGKDKGIRYRIHVGPFKNVDEAKEIISAMKANGYSAYISR